MARIVLVHGTRLNRQQWAPYHALLAGYDVVTPDLPGHGGRIGQVFTLESAVQAIAEAVGDGDEPVVLVGHSLGGYMSMEYADQHPTRLAGLVPIGAAAVPHGIGAGLYRGFAKLTDRLGDARMSAISDPLMRRAMGEELFEAVREDGLSYEAQSAAWDTVMTHADPSKLDQVTAPVLFIAGQYDQLRIDTTKFLEHCRDGRSAIITQASHFAPITHPELVAGLIRDFAAEVCVQKRRMDGQR